MIKYIKKWTVPSNSEREKIYIVALTETGEYQCSCPAWIFQRKKLYHGECWHIKDLKNHPEDFEEVSPEITGSIVEIAKVLGKREKKSEKEKSTIFLEF